MASRNRNDRQRFEPRDVGTLWTLRREDYIARCTLCAWSHDWELRVMMEEDILVARRCGNTADAFQLAEHWRRGLLEHGWEPIVPLSPLRPATREHQRNGTPLTARIRAL